MVGRGDGRSLDAEEVGQLYDHHGRALLAYARVLTPDGLAAEDVVHQVFLRLLRGDIRIRGNPMAYLFRSVRNLALNERRRHVRETPIDVDWFEGPAGMDDAALALQTALSTLPREQREVVVLRIWGQLTLEETAQAVDASANTVASRYRYALRKLRAQFEPLEGPPR